MSNTNMIKNEEYNVDDVWKKEKLSNVDDCLQKLVTLSNSGNMVEYHGVDHDYGCIRSTLDIRFEKENIPEADRKPKETSLLESFIEKGYIILPPEARRFIDIAHLKWKTLYNTGTMFIGRHYRLPTRCVDWTIDPFIALFFSCCNDFDEPGVVWWMDSDVFSYAIAKQWPLFYGKMEKIEDDFEKDFTEGKDKDILTRFRYQCFLDRPIKQKAHILLSGQYNVHHDKKIYDLGVRKCGRFVIDSNMKLALLDKLNIWGINGSTLGIEGSSVEAVSTKIAENILGKKNED